MGGELGPYCSCAGAWVVFVLTGKLSGNSFVPSQGNSPCKGMEGERDSGSEPSTRGHLGRAAGRSWEQGRLERCAQTMQGSQAG